MSICDAVLRQVVGRTLEDTAFMFAVPTDEEPPTPELRVRLDFEGGAVLVGASRAFGRVLAASLLAVEPDDPAAEDSADGALLELTNILAGLLVEAAWGSGRTVMLGIPGLLPGDAPVDPRPAAASVFLVDEEHLLHVALALTVEGAS